MTTDAARLALAAIGTVRDAVSLVVAPVGASGDDNGHGGMAGMHAEMVSGRGGD